MTTKPECSGQNTSVFDCPVHGPEVQDAPRDFVCIHCNTEIGLTESVIGAGLGNGRDFAHPLCYWRNEALNMVHKLQVADQQRDQALDMLNKCTSAAYDTRLEASKARRWLYRIKHPEIE